MHETLEAFSEHWKAVSTGAESMNELLQTFPLRSTMLEKMKTIVTKELRENPRVKDTNFFSKISLDELISLFRSILRASSFERPRPVTADPSSRSRYGAEQWFEFDDPPICGQIDLVTKRGIFEFKTGRPDPTHDEQLRFYSLLWYLSSGVVPTVLQLLYGDSRHNRQVSTPTVEELLRLKVEISESIVEIAAVVAAGNAPALLEAERCGMCPVRQMCEDYWSSEENQKVSGLAVETEAMLAYLDVEVKYSNVSWLPGRQSVGRGMSEKFGKVVTFVDQTCLPDLKHGSPISARFLRAKVIQDDSEVRVYASAKTEVFWKFQ